MGILVDVRGVRFGRLVVVDRLPAEKARSKVRWLCRCDCGMTSVTTVDQLQSGQTQSCGCLHREGLAKRNRIHGHGKPGAYGVWANMLQRCGNPNATGFTRYGGRGIKVCDRWTKFADFYADMGDRPVGSSIERIDNEIGYCIENCKWATTGEQARNTRRTLKYELDGRVQCLTDWANAYGLKVSTLYNRVVVRGMPLSQALHAPSKPGPKAMLR